MCEVECHFLVPYRGCPGLDPVLYTLGYVVNKVAEGRSPHPTVRQYHPFMYFTHLSLTLNEASN
jgi:hypothetical protein